jgi:hypothetical protein
VHKVLEVQFKHGGWQIVQIDDELNEPGGQFGQIDPQMHAFPLS